MTRKRGAPAEQVFAAQLRYVPQQPGVPEVVFIGLDTVLPTPEHPYLVGGLPHFDGLPT